METFLTKMSFSKYKKNKSNDDKRVFFKSIRTFNIDIESKTKCFCLFVLFLKI
jgi:hypothetical protein